MEKNQRKAAHFLVQQLFYKIQCYWYIVHPHVTCQPSKIEVASMTVFHKALHHKIIVTLTGYLKTSTRQTRLSDCHHVIPNSVQL